MARLSKLSLHREIKKLNRLDAVRANYSCVKEIFEKITDGLNITIGMTPGAELFFRARKNPNTKPSAVYEIAAPPSHASTGFQRCNPPGVPMFYSSSRRITALLECDVKPGDTVYLGQWIGNGPIPVNSVFATGFDNQSFAYGEVENILLPYLDTIFTRRIHSDFSDEYKFTAAIAQQLTSKFPVGAQHDIRSDGNVGIRYPSVIERGNAYNTAMHAPFAEDRLQLLHVMEFLIHERSEFDVTAEVTDNAFRFTDGHIDWCGDKNRAPQLRGKTRCVPFIWDGARWLLALQTGEISSAYVHALLSE
jgi:hypothetical protein